MKKIVEIKSKYSIKKADGKSICEGCALRIGIFGCAKRAACPDDGTGLNLFLESSEIIIQ